MFEKGLAIIFFIFGIIGFCNQFQFGVFDWFWVFIVGVGAFCMALTFFKRKDREEMMNGVTPIRQIKDFTEEELREFCQHIVSHSERYVPERVFEAKEILNSIRKDKIKNENK